MRFWLAHLAILKQKPLATSTLLQKASHINLLTELQPPLIHGGPVAVAHQLHGSGVCYVPGERPAMLPPSFLLTLAYLEQPQLIHIAVQMQAQLGLRAGQMVLILPIHLKTPGRILVPKFKKQKHAVLLPTEHIPEWLLRAFLSYSKNDLVPILPWTGEQYRTKFKQLTATYQLKHASHSARHTFASVRKLLGDPLHIISCRLIHSSEKSVYNYLHELTDQEKHLVNANPAYFRNAPLKLT